MDTWIFFEKMSPILSDISILGELSPLKEKRKKLEHQHPVGKFMHSGGEDVLCASERGTGDRVIRIVGRPRVHCVSPRCSALSSGGPVVGLAQALLSRPWQQGERLWPEGIW